MGDASLSHLFGAEITLSTESRVAAAEVNVQAKQVMAQAIPDVLGPAHLVDPVVTPGGEDFHFYTIKRPQVKATMLGLGCDLKPGLYYQHMTFDRQSLMAGIEILAKTVMLTYEKFSVM